MNKEDTNLLELLLKEKVYLLFVTRALQFLDKSVQKLNGYTYKAKK